VSEYDGKQFVGIDLHVRHEAAQREWVHWSRSPPGDGCGTGVQGLAAEKRQAATGECKSVVRAPLASAYRGHPNPVVSRVCGTWKTRQSPENRFVSLVSRP
jgi:hypothetical protein